MLAMLLPITLPTAISPLPLREACTLTAVSGALVPKATMVRPMISGGMPKRPASSAAPRTSTSAPATSSTRPPIR